MVSSSSAHLSPPGNLLLAAMSPADLALLRPHLHFVAMPVMTDLEQPNQPIRTVYFMEAGIASVVAVQQDDTKVEVGLIGREGMSGLALVMGSDRSPHSTYIQVAGKAQWIAAKELRNAIAKSDTLRSLLLKFAQVLMVQTAQTAISNARSRLDQRLARWILMAHDRTGDPTIPLTHEFLSLMLGVRRPGVTETLQKLKGRKLIDTGRSQIIIRDRRGIERMAGEAYGVPEKEYRRLIG
jgi:CRP-like cAMP-binding protein